MAPPRNLKILSLDGGGIRGLSSLEILKRVMYRVGQEMKPEMPDLQPWQYFDLIGGTSTGGIIALMLGRLRMSVQECVEEYSKLGKDVFGIQRGFPHEAMFDEKRLEDAVKRVVVAKLGKDQENAPLLDPLGKDDCCKTLVFTLPLEHAAAVQPQALRTYASKHEEALNCTIWQAARATSAAPTFFVPIEIGSPTKSFIDAGLGFNNPGQALRLEAGQIWGDVFGNLDYKASIGCFLSIGTGFAEVARLDNAETLKAKISSKFQVPLPAVQVMKAIVSGTEPVAQQLEFDFLHTPIYHRFNVEQGLQAVELFEYEKLPRIVVDTSEYLSRRRVQVSQCVVQMAQLPLPLKFLEHSELPSDLPAVPREDTEQALKQRLANLRITLHEYEKTAKRLESSSSYKDNLKGFVEAWDSWEFLVQADILDKRGTIELLRCTEEASDLKLDRSPSPLADLVARQTSAFNHLRNAFVLYRGLYHCAVLLGTSSLEYCWVANRMGDVLRLFGLRQEALQLFREAAMGRTARLGYNHKASIESTERAAVLASLMDQSPADDLLGLLRKI